MRRSVALGAAAPARLNGRFEESAVVGLDVSARAGGGGLTPSEMPFAGADEAAIGA